MGEHERQVARLLKVAGTTYADESGILMRDKPMPLFQLLTLCMLISKPISASVAMRAARELFKAGMRTPDSVLESDHRSVVGAFGRAHYIRYDESSATLLVDIAQRVHDVYAGDLRELARRSRRDVGRAATLLREFGGIGDAGADVFLREVQDVWPFVRPYFDVRAIAAARELGLPTDPEQLGALAARSNARLGAALVRTTLDEDLFDRITS